LLSQARDSPIKRTPIAGIVVHGTVPVHVATYKSSFGIIVIVASATATV
jgi:hypothetical protein